MKRMLLAVLTLCVMTSLGCETLKGLGRDIENTGQNVGEVLTGEK